MHMHKTSTSQLLIGKGPSAPPSLGNVSVSVSFSSVKCVCVCARDVCTCVECVAVGGHTRRASWTQFSKLTGADMVSILPLFPPPQCWRKFWAPGTTGCCCAPPFYARLYQFGARKKPKRITMQMMGTFVALLLLMILSQTTMRGGVMGWGGRGGS